ncbi:MAG: helix-turn-helix domain-containing protein [Oscillospiraceae bacterium]|nr:helix-turn-helix domain-containing protein [Oscillospiraceae bacterium]
MKQSHIVYPNLRAEMGRKNIGIVELAKLTNYNRDTLARKLSKKSPINLDDAFAIQQVFPNVDIRDLFQEDAAGQG